MNKQEISDALVVKHAAFTNYISELPADEYFFSNNGKWTAGQQLEHIVLCVDPILRVFSMEKPAIAQTFGRAERPGRTVEYLFLDYKEKLSQGGKAPTRFVPQTNSSPERITLSEKLSKLIIQLCSKIESFTDEELDSLLIPHPLLGNLTLREMLYNVNHHVDHHYEMTRQNLQNK
ncbi:DinB family protein [soil metagenome]